MLINRVKEDDESVNEQGILDVDGNLEEYQTANELFDIMAENKSHNLNVLQSETRDLVILYENIDLGTKLISSSINKATNQYVETVIYHDDPDSEDSDVCELYSKEDLKNIFTINNERIDLLSNIPSFENSLCHKFGNQHMKTSNFSNEYENHFLFNDPYIKEQLQSLHAMTASKQSDSAVLPMSLLDYICCKRVEENYSFYMDNIIHYVQNTIEQLKRISNGDYLTDRVKEKWREVKDVFNNKTNKSNKHIPLSSAENSPLPIVGKCSNQVFFTWDEIVHSEMDVRYLSKILEKKIIVEIPKLLCGSYKLFTKRFKDNLTLSCQRTNDCVAHMIKEKSSVDILLNLQRSETGQMNRNINSVIVLKSIRPTIIRKDPLLNSFVALRLNEIEYKKDQNLKIVELTDNNEDYIIYENNIANDSININTEMDDSESSYNDKMLESDKRFSLKPSDELGRAMHRLNIQSSVLEENEEEFVKKRKSPTRIRIKSPYENKSYVLDERKRKRLLEIRERREKKKLAMNESCKITKHKYVKGAVMAQSSNSVTKLSITNKSFYNSIYGQNNIANKKFNSFNNEQEHDHNLNIDIEESHEESKKDQSTISLGKKGQKYINRSYYLDDADTEIMYLQMKTNNEDDTNEVLTPSTSVLSSDVGAKISGFKNFINQSTTDFSVTDTSSSLHQNNLLENSTENGNEENNYQLPRQLTEVLVPRNTPKQEDTSRIDKCKKISLSVECKKSIDKIYDLMKKITVSPISPENNHNDIEIMDNIHEENVSCEGTENVAIQDNDSGTSFKFQLTSSNPSSYGFDKRNYIFEAQKKITKKKIVTTATVVPKIIISSKNEADNKIDKVNYRTKKVHKKVESKIADNPLKAISQLLHEFDSVQKTRHKNSKEVKSNKKNANVTGASRQFTLKVSSCEERNIKRSEQGNSRFFKPISPTKDLKFSQHKTDEKQIAKKKIIADIIDEVKEMRGEAVRGPSKLSARLDNLAQPKRPYVKAHRDDFQNRYSRNIIPKIQKSTINPVSVHDKTTRTNYKNRHREGIEVEQGQPKEIKKNGPFLDKSAKSRRANKSSAEYEKRAPMSANKLPNNSNVKNTPHVLDKKMVAVETYVKNHFGRVSPTRNVGGKNVVHKSRVPLIPTDIDIASLTSSPIGEESTTIGNKLHKMVNAKIVLKPQALPIFTEYKEKPCEIDKDEKMTSVEHLSKRSPTISTDHLVDIFEDKNIVTAVECVSKEDNNLKMDKDKSHNVEMQSSGVQELNSFNVLQKLENALYRQMSNGTFQKRLRLKNLTLTPKQSMQQVFVLHSGDTGSLIVKSKISQKLNFSKTDIMPNLNVLPAVSPSINFIPMQIATVGYVFPTYTIFKNRPSSNTNNLDNDFASSLHISTSKNNSWGDKSVECYKEKSERQSLKGNTDQDINMLNVNQGCSKGSCDYANDNIVRPVIMLKGKDKIECDDVRTKYCDDINHSTSLDLLVRLLNEIKNISTCQSNLVKDVNEKDTCVESKELKIILNKAGALDNSVDHSVKDSISISSLENERYIHSSNFSLLMQSNVDDYVDKYKFTNVNKTNNDVNDIQALFIDKEVNVQTSLKQIMHRLTDIPSRFTPRTINRSTEVVQSLMATVKKTSNESVCRFSDCHILYANSTFNNIKALSYLNKSQSLTSSKCKKENLREDIQTKNVFQMSRVKMIPNNILHDNTILNENIHDNSFDTLREFNPMIKMKRDVLVTVYSILVLTVFAALTIPDIISHA